MTFQDTRKPELARSSRPKRVGPVRVAVVIPCFRASGTLLSVVSAIGGEVWRIYCVDDASPDETVEAIEAAATRDPRVRLVRRPDRSGGPDRYHQGRAFDRPARSSRPCPEEGGAAAALDALESPQAADRRGLPAL